MSLINDIREELIQLDRSAKKIRNFGILIGVMLLLIALWFWFNSEYPFLPVLLTVPAFLLIALALLFPDVLNRVYIYWMGLAFTLGWVVSRLLLTLIFYLILTPVGLLARILGKDFLDSDFSKKKESYWIPYERKENHYEKMH